MIKNDILLIKIIFEKGLKLMSTKVKVNLLGFLTVLFWAMAFPFSKITISHFNINSVAVLRCGIASIFLCLLGYKKISLPKKQDIPKFFISGLFGFFLYLVFFNTGLQSLTSATSSIIIATTPIMTSIVSTFLYQEKIKWLGWIAIFIEFIGIIVLSLWNGIFSLNFGILWTLCAAAVFCIYNLYQRKLSALGYQPNEIVTYSMICGTILLLFFLPKGISEFVTAPSMQMFVILSLGIFSSAIAYILWGKALAIAEKTSDVTNFMFLTPLLSTILGFLLLKEIPSMGTFIGGTMILIGMVLFQFGK